VLRCCGWSLIRMPSPSCRHKPMRERAWATCPAMIRTRSLAKKARWAFLVCAVVEHGERAAARAEARQYRLLRRRAPVQVGWRG
jgi:hypothetical protein